MVGTHALAAVLTAVFTVIAASKGDWGWAGGFVVLMVLNLACAAAWSRP